MADVRASDGPADTGPLAGFTVAITADRKGPELRASLERLGAGVVWGSTMRAVPPEVDAELVDETDAVLESAPTWFAVSTGSGLRSWLAAAHDAGRGLAVEQMLRETQVVARGAKSHGALRALGIEPLFVSSQETMDDVCAWLGERIGPRDALGVQVHGGEVIGTIDRLRPQAREVHTVAPYRWVLPDDLAAAEQVVTDLVSGRVHVLAQTSAPSARNLIRVADRMGRRAELIEALRGAVCVAVVGPVTARAFEEVGVGGRRHAPAPAHRRPVARDQPVGARAGPGGAGAGEHGHGGAFELVPGAAVVRVGSKVVRLGAQEFAVLAALVRRPGVVVEPGELALQAWGHRTPDDVTHVRHHVSRIRRKLGEHGRAVQTVRTVGYRYVRPD